MWYIKECAFLTHPVSSPRKKMVTKILNKKRTRTNPGIFTTTSITANSTIGGFRCHHFHVVIPCMITYCRRVDTECKRLWHPTCQSIQSKQKYLTRSSAITEGLCDVLFQLKSCHLLHSCMKKYMWNGSQKIKATRDHWNCLSLIRHHHTWLPVTLRSPSFSKR